MKAIVIFSGGQDSTTCLYWAKSKFDQVHALSFVYGQNHAIEIEQAKKICTLEGVPHTTVDISFLPNLVLSALISQGNVNELRKDGLPASFVPNRNALFLTLAHAFAQKLDFECIVGGMCETDYSGYPDCRQHFIKGMESVLNYGSNTIITIHTPLMYLTKAQTFNMAYELGKLEEVIELSHTCYNGDRKTKHEWGYGCGECPACRLRANGFKEFAAEAAL